MRLERLKRGCISLLLALLLVPFSACGFEKTDELDGEETTAGNAEFAEEIQPETIRVYRAESSVIAEKSEAVLFQQQIGNGFLALVNRKTGEDIPEERMEDPDFLNDGRYDVYESELVLIGEDGKRSAVANYVPMSAPPVPPEAQLYFSQSRPRAFRLDENNEILALESSYEGWRENRTDSPFFTEDHYYIRRLESDGTEISCHEITAAAEGGGLDCGNLVCFQNGLLAAPLGRSILFFRTDGETVFTVEAPMRIRQLQKTGNGLLAVVLSDEDGQWLSIIDPTDQSVTVPQEIPADAHLFCAGFSDDTLCCVCNTELFSLSLRDFTLEPIVSLLALGVDPVYIGELYVLDDESIHILHHEFEAETGKTRELYLVAGPEEVEPTSALTLGFRQITVSMKQVILDFNRQNNDVRIEPIDLSNRQDRSQDELPDLLILDEDGFLQLLSEDKLAPIDTALPRTGVGSQNTIIPAVFQALQEGGDSLYRLSGCFRILSMAGDAAQLADAKTFSFDYLNDKLEKMPYGSSLYEPFYTAERLKDDLLAVNRRALRETSSETDSLREQIESFSAIQPEEYNYNSYIYDPRTVESRIYAGNLLLIQAKIGSLDDLKWYDSYFENGVCFAGWPTADASASRLVFDEMLAVSRNCPEEKYESISAFFRFFLSSDYAGSMYGFPVLTEELDQLMKEDAENLAYKVDDDGEWELDEEGNKIELARSSWYSAEWRRHLYYALTDAQREKLLNLIAGCI